MMTIDFCVEADGYVDISSPEDDPVDHVRVLAILEEEGVGPNHYGELYLEPDGYTINIHDH